MRNPDELVVPIRKAIASTTETIWQPRRRLRAVAMSLVEIPVHSEPARIRGRGDCGVYAA